MSEAKIKLTLNGVDESLLDIRNIIQGLNSIWIAKQLNPCVDWCFDSSQDVCSCCGTAENELCFSDSEETKSYEFNVAGIAKDNISIVQDDEILSIKGSQPETDREIDEEIPLYNIENIEEVKCEYDNGLLTVDIIEKETKEVKISW